MSVKPFPVPRGKKVSRFRNKWRNSMWIASTSTRFTTCFRRLYIMLYVVLLSQLSPHRKTFTMFSWSNNNTTSVSRRASSTYPGRRLQQNRAAASAAATPIQGSIRPPSTHTRAQHLKSFVEDPTLQRSTRRVSSGTKFTCAMIRTTNILKIFQCCVK